MPELSTVENLLKRQITWAACLSGLYAWPGLLAQQHKELFISSFQLLHWHTLIPSWGLHHEHPVITQQAWHGWIIQNVRLVQCQPPAHQCVAHLNLWHPLHWLDLWGPGQLQSSVTVESQVSIFLDIVWSSYSRLMQRLDSTYESLSDSYAAQHLSTKASAGSYWPQIASPTNFLCWMRSLSALSAGARRLETDSSVCLTCDSISAATLA